MEEGEIEHKEVIGRYKLYPTPNIYHFLMQDVIQGRTFQVIWSFDEEQRVIAPIDKRAPYF